MMFNSISRKCYAMQSVSESEAEITLYGDIVERQPCDWWGDPIEGDFIIQSEFISDLESVLASGVKSLTLHIHSFGGDVGASLLIHNRIRDAEKQGLKIKCVVDGVAMSGGSLIMCACSDVEVNPASLIMIHKCWGFIFGGYNADELRDIAKSQDAWDKAQVAAYSKKTGISETVLMHMLSETTYMTGAEAVEKGFANKLIDGAKPIEIAASASGTSLYVGGREYHLAHGMPVPHNLPITTAKADVIQKEQPENGNINEGGNTTMANNLEELRTENSALAETVESEVRASVLADAESERQNAVSAERQRIEEIDSIASLYDDETVREAKYGEHACTASEMAFRAAQKMAKSGQTFMKDVKSDYAGSGAAAVAAVAHKDTEEPKEKTSEEKKNEAKDLVHGLLSKEA